MYKEIQRKINLINFNDFVYKEYTLVYCMKHTCNKAGRRNQMETFNNAEYLRGCLKDKRAELAHLVMSEGCPILIQITEDTILRMVEAIKHAEVKA
mgnify:FL=1|tara:strand:+ start:157 stop:444 length:288 start_codon:yes stop_codon:yes gene_type:complete